MSNGVRRFKKKKKKKKEEVAILGFKNKRAHQSVAFELL